MPLVRIDVLKGRSAAELAALGEGVHRALVGTIAVPPLDRFQVITEHEPGRLIFDREYLGIARTTGFVLIQITLSSGRTVERKKALYAAIVSNLSDSPGVRPEDVFVNLVEVEKENWTFGNGIAQYST